MARPVLQARRLWVTLDGTAVCRGVDLRVDTGEVLALVGDAGAGFHVRHVPPGRGPQAQLCSVQLELCRGGFAPVHDEQQHFARAFPRGNEHIF